MMDAQQYLSQGNLQEALLQLQQEVRNNPSDVKSRVFLFQLLTVMGQWDRALTQLNLLAEMDASTLAMVQTYREAILCEGLRKDIFSGKCIPLVYGQPKHGQSEQWITLLLDALQLTSEGQFARSQDVRNQAFELAPATKGTIGETQKQSFNWIADADSRIGPMLEVIIDGGYYWLPFHRISSINIEAPEDLRDQVWMPAYFTLSNGEETIGLIPTRYVGSEESADDKIRSAHITTWDELSPDLYKGLGQRMLVTDIGEYPIMDLRRITFYTHDYTHDEKTELPQNILEQEDSSILQDSTADD